MMKKTNEEGLIYVCCPACGHIHHTSMLAVDTVRCSCGVRFQGYVCGGMVTTFVVEPDESSQTSFARFEKYYNKLKMMLVD